MKSKLKLNHVIVLCILGTAIALYSALTAGILNKQLTYIIIMIDIMIIVIYELIARKRWK